VYSFKCSKQADKNYSGFHQPFVNTLGLLQRHASHEHLDVWGADHKNIISDRLSTKTAISAHI